MYINNINDDKIIKEKKHPKNWVNGDTFILEINSSDYPQYNGEYLIFNKVDDYSWGTKSNLSVFRIKITNDKKIPKTKEELEKLDYIIVRSWVWEERFKPLMEYPDCIRQIEERSKIKYYPDEFGYLNSYLYVIYVLFSRQVPEGFQYIGNYNLTPPKDEYVPFHKGNYGFDKFNILTDKLVSSYHKYNKRNSKIYSEEAAKRRHEIERGAFEGANKFFKSMYEAEQKKKEKESE